MLVGLFCAIERVSNLLHVSLSFVRAGREAQGYLILKSKEGVKKTVAK